MAASRQILSGGKKVPDVICIGADLVDMQVQGPNTNSVARSFILHRLRLECESIRPVYIKEKVKTEQNKSEAVEGDSEAGKDNAEATKVVIETVYRLDNQPHANIVMLVGDCTVDHRYLEACRLELGKMANEAGGGSLMVISHDRLSPLLEDSESDVTELLGLWARAMKEADLIFVPSGNPHKIKITINDLLPNYNTLQNDHGLVIVTSASAPAFARFMYNGLGNLPRFWFVSGLDWFHGRFAILHHPDYSGLDRVSATINRLLIRLSRIALLQRLFGLPHINTLKEGYYLS